MELLFTLVCILNVCNVFFLGQRYWKESRIVWRLTEQGEQMTQNGTQSIPCSGEKLQKADKSGYDNQGSAELLLALFIAVRRRRDCGRWLLVSGIALLFCFLTFIGKIIGE